MINISHKRIIIAKTNQLGDVTFALPLASALKQHDPSCHIIFLGRKYSKELINHYTDIDQYADADQLTQASDNEAIHYLSSLQADIIIHVHPQKWLARLAKQARIPVRVGNARRLYNLKYCNRFVWLSRKQSPLHESQLDMLYLRRFLKHDTYSYQDIIQLRHYKNFQKNHVYELLDPNRFNVILHPLTRGRHIEWSLEHFAELIKSLPGDQFKIFLTGSEAEGQEFRQQLAAPFPEVVDLSGKTSLEELMGFIQHADGLIAASTGPVHLAANFGIKTLGLYAPIKPFDAGRWGPMGDQVTVLSKNKNCDACRHCRCTCINEISPQQVTDIIMAWAKKRALR